MAIKQDVNAPLILTIGIVSALLLLVIMFGLEAWFGAEETRELGEKFDKFPPTKTLVDLKTTQQAKIREAMPNAIQLVIQNGGKLPATRPAGGGK
jgi:hypothetical protein